MKKLKEFWGKLSPQQKVLLIILATIVIWWLVNKYKGVIQTASKTVRNNTEISILQAQGIKPSYKDNKVYQQFADSLEQYMDGAGSSEDGIYRVFKYIHNDMDFIKLDTAFGIRSGSDNLFGIIEAENLNGWILGDLSSSEVKTLNSYLKTKGITKQFK